MELCEAAKEKKREWEALVEQIRQMKEKEDAAYDAIFLAQEKEFGLVRGETIVRCMQTLNLYFFESWYGLDSDFIRARLIKQDGGVGSVRVHLRKGWEIMEDDGEPEGEQ